MAEHRPHRIHTIVLTRDRPDTLRRCLAGIVRQLGRDDALTVLDDSATDFVLANAGTLRNAARHGQITACHLDWASTSNSLSDLRGTPCSHWLVRTHDRDIAPIRNFSLLLAAAIPFETVVLVDDDIVDAAPATMHDEISQVRRPGMGVVMGAHLSGVSELDIITRLWQGIDVLARSRSNDCVYEPKRVFQASASVAPDLKVSGQYPSGGYLGFSLDSDQMTAFPPGYNEDWLWSHLQRDRSDVQVTWARHAVLHDPPTVRRPTDADCIFELTGDLALDCLETLECPTGTSPANRLAMLAEVEPGADLMPAFRLQELRESITKMNLDEKARSILLDYGLASLERLLQTGTLAVDWQSTLAEWCRNAVIAMRSFDAFLREVTVLRHVQSTWAEGQVR